MKTPIPTASLTSLVLCLAVTSPAQATNADSDRLASLASQVIGQLSYGNTIPDRQFPISYTEVCVISGSTLHDVHDAGEPTQGGACRPGDTGWVIARTEQPASTWSEAADRCREVGMRLPAVIEWQLSCRNADQFELMQIRTGSEWAANTSALIADTRSSRGGRGARASTMKGEASCEGSAWNLRATFGALDGEMGTRAFRCAQ